MGQGESVLCRQIEDLWLERVRLSQRVAIDEDVVRFDSCAHQQLHAVRSGLHLGFVALPIGAGGMPFYFSNLGEACGGRA